ncbi:MAG: glycosyltransferase family 87 protein [Rhodomicrobium sp.]
MTEAARAVSWRYFIVLTVWYALSALLYYWIFYIVIRPGPGGDIVVALIPRLLFLAFSAIFSVLYVEIVARPVLDHTLYRWLLSVLIGVLYVSLSFVIPVFAFFYPLSLVFPLFISAFLGKTVHNRRFGNRLFGLASAVILVLIQFALSGFLSWRENYIWEHSATSFETVESQSCWTGEQQLLNIPKAFIADKNQRHSRANYGWVTIAVSYPDLMPWNLESASADGTDRVEIVIWKSQCHRNAYYSSYTKYSHPQFNVYCKDEKCEAKNRHSGAGDQYIHFSRKHLTEFPAVAARVNALIESWHHN